MSYQKKKIHEVIQMIVRNELYLPAIQRKFVWKPDQIERLFDSIMRGYPIGTFLFWFVRGDKKNDYTFYKFLLNYHERDAYLNEIAPRPELRDEIIGVLDGQQRLSGLYISLQGTYAYKNPRARWENDEAFPKRELFLNLIYAPPSEEPNDILYEFSFLLPSDATDFDNEHLWFRVRNVLLWGDEPQIDDYYDSLFDSNFLNAENKKVIREKKSFIKRNLRILHQRLVLEELLSFYQVEDQKLDNILDIFVRVNSGGTVLSKSDLLFSTIVANWQDGREEIEHLLETINSKGRGFWFDNDFIMRCCLVLTDCPVLFKVDNFKKENMDKIRKCWKQIKSSISTTIDLLVILGFSGETLTSHNAIIPIAYHFIKRGTNKDSRSEIRRYLIHVLLKQTFGGQGDQVLSSLRETLRKKKGKEYVLACDRFSFTSLLNAKLPGNRSMKITDEDIQEMLTYRKSAYSFIILSFLYPQLKFGQIEFHQDHIHPSTCFTDSKLKKAGIPNTKWTHWQEINDTLPNLQIMEGQENESKQATPFKDWIVGHSNGCPNVADVAKFKTDNFIPSSINLSINHFDKFYEERRSLLEKAIRKVLK
jgi:uncharacterized protein with ParB-like and HNH nuclease domain